MVEILSPVELNKWLSDKPKKFGQFIAYRAACRDFIEIDEFLAIDSMNQEIKNDLILNLVRALIVSEVALYETDTAIKEATFSALSSLAQTITKIDKIGFEIIQDTDFFSQNVDPLDEDQYLSSKQVQRALRTVHQSLTGNTTRGETNRSDSAAFVIANEADEIRFDAIKEDINFLNNDDLTLRLSLILPSEYKILNAIQFKSLTKTLLKSSVNWQFWIAWYQAKLDGTLHSGLTQSQQEDLYYQIATFPNELWEEGAEAVNQRIAELLEGSDGVGKDFFLDDGLLDHDFLTGENQNDKSSQNMESSSTNTEQFRTLVNSPEFRSNIGQNKVAISCACAGLIVQLEEYKKTVSESNSLEPELKEQLIGTLDNLTEAVNNIGNNLGTDGDAISDKELEEVASYFSRFCEVVTCELEKYIAPENVGKALVPTSIILSCGGLGALLGGSIGFGVGGFIGKLITGNLKPKEIVDKIEENIDNKPN